jgi:Outer membrane protein Omp28
MVNRRQVDGSYIIGATKWASEVANVLSDTSQVPLKITITNDFNPGSRELNTEIESEFFTSLNGDFKLCVFMVEDSIINWQKDYDATPEDVEFYTHREVLRGSMNGTYGSAVTETAEGNISSLSYTYTLPVEWNEAHVSIIAYLYNEATKEILQVEQREIE